MRAADVRASQPLWPGWKWFESFRFDSRRRFVVNSRWFVVSELMASMEGTTFKGELFRHDEVESEGILDLPYRSVVMHVGEVVVYPIRCSPSACCSVSIAKAG